MGPYIVDFVCHHHRLVIEVDGGIHKLDAVSARDVERQEWLEARGYTVVRIPNDQAIYDADSTAQRIASMVGADTPTPNPSPQGGGEP